MFGRLYSYTVHTRGEVQDLGHVEFVRDGFNVFAFLFGAFWALYQRLWLAAAAVILLQSCALQLVHAGVMTDAGASMVQLLLSLALGLFGNELVRQRLARKGYVLTDIVMAENETKATLRLLDRAI